MKLITALIATYRKHLAEQRDARERSEIARLFNDRYTYREQYVEGAEQLPGTAMFGLNPRGGFAWMCPTCNRVHHPTTSSVFSGLQYPACCTRQEGHRLHEGIRTK